MTSPMASMGCSGMERVGGGEYGRNETTDYPDFHRLFGGVPMPGGRGSAIKLGGIENRVLI